MVVDAVDGERIDVAAGRAEHDQSAVLHLDVAFKAEDFSKRDLGNAAAADRRDAGPAYVLERDRLAIGADDLLDRRPRDGKVLRADRYRQRRDDRQRQRDAQSHPRALAQLAVDLDDPADPLD